MQKQASKVYFSLFVLLSLSANHTISTDSSEQYAPTASESENKSASSESYFSVPPGVVSESNEKLTEENVSTLSDSNDVETKGEQTVFDQELASSPSVNGDDNYIPTSPPIVDNSVLDTRDMDSLSSVPLSKADPPASETKQSSIEDLPPTSVESNVSQDNTLVPSSSPPLLSPATQENQSPPSTTVSESEKPENVPQLNDYSSLSIAAVPAPSDPLSYPMLDPTIQSTPSNYQSYDSAPTSNQHETFPFNYRAEEEPLEPYEEEEDSWIRANGAMACVLVGAFVIGVGGFVYQKRKKDDVRAQHQYECLTKKEGV